MYGGPGYRNSLKCQKLLIEHNLFEEWILFYYSKYRSFFSIQIFKRKCIYMLASMHMYGKFDMFSI